jgi:uncharacterized protein (DUF362 family)
MTQALDHLELETMIRGKRVAVKPSGPRAPAADTTAVTQPQMLHMVLRYMRHSGPRELVVTEGAGTAETAEVFRLAEVIDVVAQEGAPSCDPNRSPSAAVAPEYTPEADVQGPKSQSW